MSEEQVKYKVEADDRPAPTVTAADVSAAIAKVDYHVLFGTTITICVLTLQNGFTITGQSACASPENFNQVIGQDYAYLDAKEKVWQYLGYELKTKLDLISKAVPLVEGSLIYHHGKPKTYVGTKVVHAIEMNRLDYCILRGWRVPADENPEDEGYLVQSTDGAEPNLKGFNGYVSWLTKTEFDRTYGDTKVVQESVPTTTFLQSRLFVERDELQEKTDKLNSFLKHTPATVLLTQEEEKLLNDQAKYMGIYLAILEKRIKLHTSKM